MQDAHESLPPSVSDQHEPTVTQLTTEPPLVEQPNQQPSRQSISSSITPRNRGRGFRRPELECLFEIIATHLPQCPSDWDVVAKAHHERFPESDRNGSSLQNKFKRLCGNPVPVRHPKCPWSVRRAKMLRVKLLGCSESSMQGGEEGGVRREGVPPNEVAFKKEDDDDDPMDDEDEDEKYDAYGDHKYDNHPYRYEDDEEQALDNAQDGKNVSMKDIMRLILLQQQSHHEDFMRMMQRQVQQQQKFMNTIMMSMMATESKVSNGIAQVQPPQSQQLEAEPEQLEDEDEMESLEGDVEKKV